MFDFLYKTCRRFCNWFAAFVLVAVAIDPLGDMFGLSTRTGLAIVVCILAGSILLERKLEKLMMAEAWKESLDVDLEAASDKIFQEEKERRRREGKSV